MIKCPVESIFAVMHPKQSCNLVLVTIYIYSLEYA